MKKSRKILVGVSVVIAVAFSFLVISDVLNLPFQSLSTLNPSTCVLSADTISLTEDHTELGKKAWVIRGMSGDCAEKVVGGAVKVDNEEVKSGEKKARKDFTLWTGNIKEWFERSLSKSEGIVEPEQKVYDCTLGLGYICGQDVRDKCSNWQAQTDYEVGEFSVVVNYGSQWVEDYKLECYRYRFTGSRYRISSSESSKFSMDVKNCVSGSCTTGHLSSDKKQVNLDLYGDKKAVMEYTGSLVDELSGVSIKPSYKAVRDSGGNMYLTTDELWNNYESPWGEDIMTLKSKCKDNPSKCDDYFGNWQSTVNDVFSDASGQLEGEPNIDNVKVTSNDLKIYSDVISYPTWRLVLSAEDTWIGLIVPEPQPNIKSVSSSTFKDDSRGKVIAEIENTGNDEGYIDATLSCPSPLSGDTQSKYVSSGETKTYNLYATSSSVESKTTKTCTLTAKTKFNSDSQGVDVTVKPSCKDPDNDDICSQYDNCPFEAGPKANNGCPPPCEPLGKEKTTVCPSGQVIVIQRCKDPDGDGVGEWIKTGNVCPGQRDSDGDGVPDPQDLCPNTPVGTKVNEKGCEVSQIPWKIVIVAAAIVVAGAIVGYFMRKR